MARWRFSRQPGAWPPIRKSHGRHGLTQRRFLPYFLPMHSSKALSSAIFAMPLQPLLGLGLLLRARRS